MSPAALAESRRLRAEARAEHPDLLPRRTGWTLPVTCTCGSTHLDHINGTGPELLGARATAIARCHDCHREWQITALLTPVGERERGRQ